jgi:hypothetical protein
MVAKRNRLGVRTSFGYLVIEFKVRFKAE